MAEVVSSIVSSSSPSYNSTPTKAYDIQITEKLDHVDVTEVSSLEASIEHAQDDAAIRVSRSSRIYMTAIFCIGMLVNGLDFNVLGDASPYIAAHFGVFDKINWMSTATLLAAVASLLLTSKAMNFIETKYFFMSGFAIMAVGEALAGASTSYNMLLVGRICSGLSAPIILIVGTTVTGMIWNSRMRPLMISIVIACYGVMIKVGPLVAGALLKRSILLWRWCFFVQLPALGCLIVVTLFVFPRIGVIDRRSPASVLKRCALPGLCQAAAFVCILFPLVAGGTSQFFRWSGPSLIFCYIAGPTFFAIFAYLELRNEEPDRYLPWEALRADRSVAMMGIVTFCSMFTIFGATFYLPVMYQLVFKSSPIHAAVQLLPNAIAGTIATVVVGKIAERTGHFIPSCIVCSIIQIVGGALCTQLSAESPMWKIYVFTAISGIGAGGTASIGTPFTLEKISLKRYGAATAFSNLCLLFGAGIGVASLGVVLANRIESIVPAIHELNPAMQLGDNIWQNLILIFYGDEAIQKIFRKAFMQGIDIASILFAGMGVVSLLASLGMRWQKMHQHDATQATHV